jgi:hypothetical protein
MVKGGKGREGIKASSRDAPKRKGRILAACSSLKMFDLSNWSCSGVRVSACATRGIILVSGERRRRYSISTGLTPIEY